MAHKLYTDDFSITPTDLSDNVQVIGAGMGRTGTVSFSYAIQKLLNGPVCHGGNASLHREVEFIQTWTEICNPLMCDAEKKKKLQHLLRGYVATADVPCLLFVKELAELYPDAKVICTTRDPDRWYASLVEMQKTVSPWWASYVLWPIPTLRWINRWTEGLKMRCNVIYPAGRNQPNGPEFLEVHHEYVKACVPPDRLFFYNVKEGWAPLCKILNVPIPDEPFPHANDKAQAKRALTKLIKIAALRWLGIFAGIGITSITGIYILKRIVW